MNIASRGRTETMTDENGNKLQLDRRPYRQQQQPQSTSSSPTIQTNNVHDLQQIDEILQWLDGVGCEIDDAMSVLDNKTSSRNCSCNSRCEMSAVRPGRVIVLHPLRPPSSTEPSSADESEADVEPMEKKELEDVEKSCPSRCHHQQQQRRRLQRKQLHTHQQSACRQLIRQRQMSSITNTVSMETTTTRSNHSPAAGSQSSAAPTATYSDVTLQESGSGRTHIETLDRVSRTESVWNLGCTTRAAAIHVLQNREDGAFVVRSADAAVEAGGTMTSSMLLHVRQAGQIRQFPIQLNPNGCCKLLDSSQSFGSLASLISYYCQSRNGLRLDLPTEIKRARTMDELDAIARLNAEFWVSLLPSSKMSSTQISQTSSTTSTRRIQTSDGCEDFQASEQRCENLRHDVQLRTCNRPANENGCRRITTEVEKRSFSSIQATKTTTNASTSKRAEQKVIHAMSTVDDKASDYEDVWTIPTPGLSPIVAVDSCHTFSQITGRTVCTLDPQKYQLADPDEMEKPKNEAAGCNAVLRGADNCDRLAVPSVFNFDAKNRENAAMSDALRPSPVYAEPFDALPVSTLTESKRVSVRRREVTAASSLATCSSSTQKVNTTSCQPASISSSPVSAIPMSAGYRQPCDILVSRGATDCPPTPPPPLCDTLPPPPLPPRETTGSILRPRQKTVPQISISTTASASRNEFARSEWFSCDTATSEGQFSELLGFDSAERAEYRSGVESTAVLSRFYADQCISDDDYEKVGDDGRKVWQSDRGSEYDNLSIGEPLRSRRMTGCSMHTEYSPPWDGDRVREIIEKNRQLCVRDPQSSLLRQPSATNHNSVQDISFAVPVTMEFPDDFVYSEPESGAETADDSEYFGTRAQHGPSFPIVDHTSTVEWLCHQGSPASNGTCNRGISISQSQQPIATLGSSSFSMSRVPAEDVRWTQPTRPQRSPDVIPSLTGPKLISPRNRGHKFPGAKIGDFIVQLSSKKPETMFGALVQCFIQCTINGAEKNPRSVVRNIRQFMNGIKNYLRNGGEEELNKFVEAFRAQMKATEFLNLDAVMEHALIKCIVKPLKEHVYRLFEYDYTRTGSLQKLCDGLKLARTVTPPRASSRQLDSQSSSTEVQHFLHMMEMSYSPLKKLENLLGAMMVISSNVSGGTTMSGSSAPVNADDLLSTVVSMLARQNMMSAEIEAGYMWGLLHPSFLAGDARYYLTTFSSAIDQLKNLRRSMELTATSQDITMLTTLADMDGYITVMTADELCDSITKHMLPVRPAMAARDICSMLAHRLRITNPQDYGLYSLASGTEKWLSYDAIIPSNVQKSSIERRQNLFIYKRTEAHFVWSQDLLNM